MSLRLSFVPCVLTHTTLLHDPNSGSSGSISSLQVPTVDILLAGSDRSVHVYRFSRATRAYTELPFTPAHPLAHLHGLPSSVLSLDVAACSPDRRSPCTYIVAGCQDGLVRVATRRGGQRVLRRRAQPQEEDEEIVHSSGATLEDITASLSPSPRAASSSSSPAVAAESSSWNTSNCAE